MIEFMVAGIPLPEGSTRARLNQSTGLPYVVHQNRSNLMAWRHSISDEARKAMALRPAYAGPVKVDLRFALPKPVSRPKKDRWPSRKPDLDKLIRAALDGLTGITFVDDAQVVILSAQKAYFNPAVDLSPGLLIRIWATDEGQG